MDGMDGMGGGIFGLLLLGLLLLIFGVLVPLGLACLWLIALVESLKTSKEDWEAIGQNKWLWVFMVVFLPVVGALAYLVRPHVALERLRKQHA